MANKPIKATEVQNTKKVVPATTGNAQKTKQIYASPTPKQTSVPTKVTEVAKSVAKPVPVTIKPTSTSTKTTTTSTSTGTTQPSKMSNTTTSVSTPTTTTPVVTSQPASSQGYVYKPLGDNKDSNVSAPSDVEALNAAKAAYGSAKTQAEKDAAHAQAEAIRAKYGYSGGLDGSTYVNKNTGQNEVMTPQVSDKIDDYLATIQQAMEGNADAQYQSTLNTIKQQLQSELNAAGIDVDKIESDYNNNVSSINQDVYTQTQEQLVNSTSRGILQSQQQLGLEQGVNARANDAKFKSYTDRQDRIVGIQNRIADIRSKANVAVLDASLQKNKTINDATIAIAGKQVDRMINNEQSDKALSNAQILEGLKQKYTTANIENAQSHDKEMSKISFDNDIKKMGLSAQIQERLQRLDSQTKYQLQAMDNANRVSLMQMDNANKMNLLSAEVAIKEKFFNMDANLQKDILEYQGNLSQSEFKNEMMIQSLKDSGTLGLAFGNGAITNSDLTKASNHYVDEISKLKKYNFGFGLFDPTKIWNASATKDPVLDELTSKITGKTVKELSKMKGEDVAKLFQSYSDKQIEQNAKDIMKQLEGYSPKIIRKQYQ